MIWPVAAANNLEQLKRESLARKLHDLSQLPAWWNGPRSNAIDSQVLEHADQFIQFIASHENLGVSMPSPEISPMPDGGVSFEWTGGETAGRELVVFMRPGNNIEFVAANDATGYELSGVVQTFSELLPQLSWLIDG